MKSEFLKYTCIALTGVVLVAGTPSSAMAGCTLFCETETGQADLVTNTNPPTTIASDIPIGMNGCAKPSSGGTGGGGGNGNQAKFCKKLKDYLKQCGTITIMPSNATGNGKSWPISEEICEPKTTPGGGLRLF